MLFSIFVPSVITPFSHGVSPEEGFTYLRSCYGVFVTLGFAVAFTFLGRDADSEPGEGLSLSSLTKAMENFKGGIIDEAGVGESSLSPWRLIEGSGEIVRIPASMAQGLSIKEGDIVYLADPRWWLGGLRSVRAKAAGPATGQEIEISKELS